MNASASGQQPDRIDIDDPAACEHWARKLDCSRDQLKDAVKAVGNQAADVEVWLKGVHSTTNSDRVREAGAG